MDVQKFSIYHIYSKILLYCLDVSSNAFHIPYSSIISSVSTRRNFILCLSRSLNYLTFQALKKKRKSSQFFGENVVTYSYIYNRFLFPNSITILSAIFPNYILAYKYCFGNWKEKLFKVLWNLKHTLICPTSWGPGFLAMVKHPRMVLRR